MFDRATATAAHEAGEFFARSTAPRQVWARRAGAAEPHEAFYLPPDGVTAEIRKLCADRKLLCPVAGCPAPEFIARGGQERRHHFAHHPGAGVGHQDREVWLREATAMLAAWANSHTGITAVEDDNTVSATSARSGVTVIMRVIYDDGFDPTADCEQANRQVVVGHTRRLLLPRAECTHAPNAWWCGEPRLVGQLIGAQGHAVAVNPEQRRVATLASAAIACRAGLIPDSAAHSSHPVIALVHELEECRLSEKGIVTPVQERLDACVAEAKREELEREEQLKRLLARPRSWQQAETPTRPAWPRELPSEPRNPHAPEPVRVAEHNTQRSRRLNIAAPRPPRPGETYPDHVERNSPPSPYDYPLRARDMPERPPDRWDELADDVSQIFNGRLPAFLTGDIEPERDEPGAPDVWRAALYRIFIVRRRGESISERQVIGALIWHQWYAERRWNAAACARAARSFLSRLGELGMIVPADGGSRWRVV